MIFQELEAVALRMQGLEAGSGKCKVVVEGRTPDMVGVVMVTGVGVRQRHMEVAVTVKEVEVGVAGVMVMAGEESIQYMLEVGVVREVECRLEEAVEAVTGKDKLVEGENVGAVEVNMMEAAASGEVKVEEGVSCSNMG
ncbi:hypothetical protein SAY86_009682 [Trapa natans]|uniref:Uncharacterized protein n=1 Tax=Trapa natans TaxID=22666 RepID=A0AAN7KWF5_TRANT|nr:hypothetical protein SAY86_009682 [Trapa natans]